MISYFTGTMTKIYFKSRY